MQYSALFGSSIAGLSRKNYCKDFYDQALGDYAGAELMDFTNFQHLGPFPPTKKVLVIAGNLGFNPFIKESNDGKVAVKETFLNTPHEHCVVGAGHSWISLSPKVIRVAKAFLFESGQTFRDDGREP